MRLPVGLYATEALRLTVRHDASVGFDGVTKVLIVAAGEIVASGLRDVLIEGGCTDARVVAGPGWSDQLGDGELDVIVVDETSGGPVADWVSAGLRVIVVSPEHARMTVYTDGDGGREGPLTEALLVAAASSAR